MATSHIKFLIFLSLTCFLTITTSHAQSLTFTWSMDEHFEECAKAYNDSTHLYDKNILKPKEGWVVKFELNNPSCANCVYTWDIQGTGEYAQYHKVYTTPLYKLFAEYPIRNNLNTATKYDVLRAKPTNKVLGKNQPKTGTFQKMKDPQGRTPPGRFTPTAMQVDRLPGTGSYIVTLTAKQPISNAIQTFRQTVTLTNYLIVCIGDSFNSGEGNPSLIGEPSWINRRECNIESFAAAWYANGENDNTITLDRPASWLEGLAHRSLSSGAAIAARSVEINDPHSVVTFINLATSGAETRKGLLAPQHDWQAFGQIEEVKNFVGNTPINALLLAIGINDIGFSDMLYDATIGTIDQLYKQSNPDSKLAQFDRSYELVNDAIHRGVNVKNILITEYPWPIFSTENADHAQGCELFNVTSYRTHIYGINSDEALLFHRIGQDLSNKMREEAADHNWIFIDGIADAFKGHGYCATNSYYIHAQESCLYLGNIKGTMHPNIKGHEIISKKIYEKLKTVLLPQKKPDTH